MKAALVLLALAALGLRVVFAHASLTNVPVNGDEGMSFLLAQDIARGSRPLFFWTQPYQFPFESYFVSLFTAALPWDPLGARLPQILVCTVSVAGFLLIYRQLAPLRTAWPGVLLILFPSAYLLTRQAAAMTPQHAAMATAAWALPLIVALQKRSGAVAGWSLAGGVLAGAALSNHLLSLSLVAMCGAALCFARDRTSSLRASAGFLAGLAVGLAPYLYAKLFVPGAYQQVAESMPIASALERLWHPVVTAEVPTALGIDPWYFPDAGRKITSASFLVEPFAYVFVALLLYVTAVRAVKFFRRLRETRWPSLDLNDVFTGTTWLALLLLSMTAMELRSRYVLHLVWCFPFLVSYAYATAPRAGRIAVGAAAVLLVALNVRHSAELVSIWRDPDFARVHANLPSLKPLYAHFRRHGITRCYAGWWLSYRIIVHSRERIICSPPFNDRFQDWPQPYYREIVDRSANTPYVAGPYLHRYLRPDAFEGALAEHRIAAERSQVGAFRVYRNFRHLDASVSHIVSPEETAIRVSHNEGAAGHAADGDRGTVWTSGAPQHAGMWIETALPNPRPIHAVRILSRDKVLHLEPPRVRIEAALPGGGWSTLVSGKRGMPHLVKLDEHGPRFHHDGLELLFGVPETETHALRVSIEEPSGAREWRIAELQLFTDAAAPSP